jgi:hypothetical protein
VGLRPKPQRRSKALFRYGTDAWTALAEEETRPDPELLTTSRRSEPAWSSYAVSARRLSPATRTEQRDLSVLRGGSVRLPSSGVSSGPGGSANLTAWAAPSATAEAVGTASGGWGALRPLPNPT